MTRRLDHNDLVQIKVFCLTKILGQQSASADTVTKQIQQQKQEKERKRTCDRIMFCAWLGQNSDGDGVAGILLHRTVIYCWCCCRRCYCCCSLFTNFHNYEKSQMSIKKIVWRWEGCYPFFVCCLLSKLLFQLFHPTSSQTLGKFSLYCIHTVHFEFDCLIPSWQKKSKNMNRQKKEEQKDEEEREEEDQQLIK